MYDYSMHVMFTNLCVNNCGIISIHTVYMCLCVIRRDVMPANIDDPDSFSLVALREIVAGIEVFTFFSLSFSLSLSLTVCVLRSCWCRS